MMRMRAGVLVWAVCVVLAACGDDAPRGVQAQPGTPDEEMGEPTPDMALDMVAADMAEPVLPRGSCPPLTGPGTDHMNEQIGDSVVWSAESSPHRVLGEVFIGTGGSVLVDSCAVVLIGKDQSIVTNGIFEAVGTSTRPVLIWAADLAQPFGALSCNDCIMNIFHTSIKGGGSPGSGATAMVRGSGRSAKVADGITLDNVTLSGSAGYGLELAQGAGLSARTQALTITGSAKAPVLIAPKRVGTLPQGSYTGNMEDEIVVSTDEPLDESSAWPARPLPYRTEGSSPLIVGGSVASPAVLTLEAGARVRFGNGAMLIMDAAAEAGGALTSTGALIAQGTAQAPVVFEGYKEDESVWGGILFRAAPTATSRIDHAVIAHAGASPALPDIKSCDQDGGGRTKDGEGAGLTLLGIPAAGLVTNTTFRLSRNNAIEHAYLGQMVDLSATNTFEMIEGCIQTRPRDADGMCPVQGYTCP